MTDDTAIQQYRKHKKKNSPLKSFFSLVKKSLGYEPSLKEKREIVKKYSKTYDIVSKSNYISRDISWLKFDERVLDQARNPKRNIFERLKFLAITSSNLDEFFAIRVGSLYNYLDFGRERTDYSGLREQAFLKTLMAGTAGLQYDIDQLFEHEILPALYDNHLQIVYMDDLQPTERQAASNYFNRTIYPMLTPMVFDQTHTFPSLLAKTLIFGVVSRTDTPSEGNEGKKLSFVQIPQNLPRFFFIERDDRQLFLPIEEIIRYEISKLYRNVEILSVCLFRISRNGDFDLVEHEDTETDFIDEVKQKIKDRRLGRVTRIEIEPEADPWFLALMQERWKIDNIGVFEIRSLIDHTGFWQILAHPEIKAKLPASPTPIPPMGHETAKFENIFEEMKKGDILLHHPYNSFEPVVQLLEQAASDPQVLAIKVTLYRISKNSRIANALLTAAENGKHVSVLFEVKARFDEERNIREAQRLQKAGCFVIFGIQNLKTHTKLLQVIRQEGNGVVGYAHLSSGNYNEDTAKLYTDISLLTTNETYTRDISEFFNVITGHSQPSEYQNLITAPRDMRRMLIEHIRTEATNAQNDQPSGICIKLNSLQDKQVIDELYLASQAGVPIRLIVRGICCIRPGRAGLSDNITVRSIVGDYLEHTRIYYFHNAGEPKIYGGSADIMVRSFDRRIESLFRIVDPNIQQQLIYLLKMNLLDTSNAYLMHENGEYEKLEGAGTPVNIHRLFFEPMPEQLADLKLF
jgi:polyphosphate kinase